MAFHTNDRNKHTDTTENVDHHQYRHDSWCFHYLPRSNKLGRKRPFLTVFRPFGSDCITTVIHRIVNERKRSDTRLSGSLRPLLTVYDTVTNYESDCLCLSAWWYLMSSALSQLYLFFIKHNLYRSGHA
jgi:hypothetical protein